MNYLSLAARISISAIFIIDAVIKILNPIATRLYMEANGIPGNISLWLLAISVTVQIIGSVFILLNVKAKIGALILVIFMIPTTMLFHMNWFNSHELTQFLKNLAIIGGLLMVIKCGPGQLRFKK